MPWFGMMLHWMPLSSLWELPSLGSDHGDTECLSLDVSFDLGQKPSGYSQLD